jgi:tetratricopeptide (TPR) repeat protein
MKKMFVPIMIVVLFLLAGSVAAVVILNKPQGLSGQSGKGDKNQSDNAPFVQAALKKLASDPLDTDALLVLGEQYYKQEDWEKTFKTYQALCDSSKGGQGVDYFEIHFRCGLAAAKIGMLAEAHKNLIVAASFNESDYRVQFELGHLSFLNGNHEKAVGYLTKAQSINPEHAPTLCTLGHAYFKLKKFKEAMVNIRKALDVIPGDKETLFTLAECYEESSQSDQAVRIYSHLRADPEWGPSACLAAGLIHARSQQMDEAISDYEIGLKHGKLKPDVALELHYQLALIQLKMNNIGEGLAHLNIIKEEQPDYKSTEKLIGQYGEVHANRGLQTYTMAQPDEFLALCRKIIIAFYQNAKIKVTQTNVRGDEWADILAEISTSKWVHLIGFRFFRSQGNIGELVVRDFHEHLKNAKADKGICFAAGTYTDEAKHFTEVRLIELIDKSHLLVHLAAADRITQPGLKTGI